MICRTPFKWRVLKSAFGEYLRMVLLTGKRHRAISMRLALKQALYAYRKVCMPLRRCASTIHSAKFAYTREARIAAHASLAPPFQALFSL